MKYRILFGLIIFYGIISCASSGSSPTLGNSVNSLNQKDFESSIIQIIKAYQKKNESILNQFISKEYGLYFIFRPGAMNSYSHSNEFKFSEPTPSYWPYENDLNLQLVVSTQNTPQYSCETDSWSSKGILISKPGEDFLLTETMKFNNMYEIAETSQEELIRIENLEKISRKVYVIDEDGTDFIFTLTPIQDRWFLTIIDRVSSDCSA